MRQEQRYRVRISSLLKIALASLTAKKFRSAITIIGISIGAGSVFLLMSFGLGLQSLVEQQISDGLSVNTVDVSVSGSRLLKLDSDSVKTISAISSVEEASGFFAKASKLTVSGATADVVLYGVDDLYLKTSGLTLKAGRNIASDRADEIVVSSSVLEALGVSDFNSTLDSKVKVQLKIADQTVEKQLTIVGVSVAGVGSEAFVTAGAYQQLGAESYSGAKVLVNSRDNVPDVRRAIESMGFVTASPIDTLNQVDQFFRVLRLILVSFGTIGMFIAVLGMINTLTVSLLERTKEVALMLALGARPRDMKLLFIIEALLMSLIGAICGIIGALIFGRVIDIVLNQLAEGRGAMAGFSVFEVPWWLIVVSLAVMALVGLIVAYIPATRASRISSIDTLRRE